MWLARCGLIVWFLSTASTYVASSLLGPIPIFSLTPFPESRVQSLLRSYEGAPANHLLEGSIIPFAANATHITSQGFRILTRSVTLGKGKALYEKAVNLALSFDVVNEHVNWAKIRSLQNSVGAPLASVTKVYGFLYSFNPCRIIDICRNKAAFAADLSSKEQKKCVYSQACFTAVEGHLIAGEERFRVIHSLPSDEVEFELFSFTKGNGLLGRVAMVLIRPLQRRFFQDIISSMLKQCAAT